MKTFNSNVDYDDMGVEEINILLSFQARIKEVEHEIMRITQNAS